MRLLPKHLRKEGFDFDLVERKGHVCIYRQHRPFSDEECDGLEVIIPHIYNKNWSGSCEPYESYPSTNEWGKRGFSFGRGRWNTRTESPEPPLSPEMILNRARIKMRELLLTTKPERKHENGKTNN